MKIVWSIQNELLTDEEMVDFLTMVNDENERGALSDEDASAFIQRELDLQAQIKKGGDA